MPGGSVSTSRRTRLLTAPRTLRCLCKRQRWRGVVGNRLITAARSPSRPSLTMRSSLCRSACSQVFKHAYPAVFAFLSAGQSRQRLFVAGQVHAQRCQDHGRIDLVAVTHAEIDRIKARGCASASASDAGERLVNCWALSWLRRLMALATLGDSRASFGQLLPRMSGAHPRNAHRRRVASATCGS